MVLIALKLLLGWENEMKKRSCYYDKICIEISIYTKKALSYGNAKAWSNKKDKAYRKIVPRGKVFDRLHKQEWGALTKLVNDISTKWQKIKT